MPTEKKTRHCEWEEGRLRFRFAGIVTILLACFGWAAWFYPFDDLVDRSGKPLGGDFVMLYVAGQAFAEGSPLYDDALNQKRSAALFPAMDPHESWPYRYPPTVAAVASLFARLPFATSFIAFCFIQIVLLGVSLWLLLPLLRTQSKKQNDLSIVANKSWLLALLGCPIVLECILGGQCSLLALTCVSLFLHLHHRGYSFFAGCVLAIALYKPNVLGLFIVGILVAYPRYTIGFAVTAIVGLATTCWLAGIDSLQNYIQLAFQLSQGAWGLETPYWKVHGFAPTFQSLLPAHGKLTAGLLGLALSICIAVRHRKQKLDWDATVASLLVVNAIFNPYIPIYDLVLLIPATIYTVRHLRNSESNINPIAAQLMLASLWLGPHISQAASIALGFQIFPWLLSLVAIVTLAKRKPALEKQSISAALAP